jgi:predicted GIY-YIG superfamily endonuclease
VTKPTARWWVYVVRCADGSLYTGIAIDVARRVARHNAGRASKYTRSRRPVTLVYRERQPDRGAALRREAAIKALTRRMKEALIARKVRR